MNIPTVLEARRRQRKMHQADLAREAGVSRALVAAIEAGSNTTGPGAQKIADYLGVDVNVLSAHVVIPNRRYGPKRPWEAPLKHRRVRGGYEVGRVAELTERR